MLEEEMFPAASISRTDREPPDAMALCSATAVVSPKVNVTVVSDELITSSVAITVESSRSCA